MSSANNSFFANAWYNFHRRRLLRWVVFTYPKSTASFATAIVAGAIFVGMRSVREQSRFALSFKDAIHSDDNKPKKSINGILIYDGSNK